MCVLCVVCDTVQIHESREDTKPQKESLKAYCDKINSRIQNEIHKRISADLKNTYSYDSFDIDKLVSETDPDL